MFGNATALEGLHVTGKYSDRSMEHTCSRNGVLINNLLKGRLLSMRPRLARLCLELISVGVKTHKIMGLNQVKER